MANVHPRYSKFFQTPKSESEAQEELRAYEAHKELVSSLPNENGSPLPQFLDPGEAISFGILFGQKRLSKVLLRTNIFLCTYFRSESGLHPWIRALRVRGGLTSRRRPTSATSTSSRRSQGSSPPTCLTPSSADSVKPRPAFVCLLADPKRLLSSNHSGGSPIANELPNSSLRASLERDLRGGFCQGYYSGPIWDHQMEYLRRSVKRPGSRAFLRLRWR
ncbi:uncharacterized protein A4U43_C09F2070 [Asparagus officinalis]|uniref:Uncharacterized protein n=1 Tax=Asparagus officinalis TaxID=4686 RepID=A0A5P1E4L1_ASPOF|nr:uncharacterized protein A4U43_C09F2070 [Asparagus officinalis]